MAGDCGDGDPSVYPGATDAPYDGVDSDCAGDDDFDADSDGHASAAWGGDDGDDQDPDVYATAPEGWSDLAIDNDCDDSVSDPIMLSAAEATARIDGLNPGDGLGTSVFVVSEGIAGGEDLVLVSAPYAEDTRGAVYGWSSTDVASGADPASASWTWVGESDEDYLGFGIGTAGTSESPMVFVSAEGVGDARGRIYGWLAGSGGLEATPTVTIAGENEGAYFGYGVLSGYDHDGDGADDLVVSAPWDSTHALYAGAVVVFLDPASLSSATTADADVTFYAPNSGAHLDVSVAGDYDGDGLDDLAFFREVEDVWDGGGLLVTGARNPGTYDVKAEAVWRCGGPICSPPTWTSTATWTSSVSWEASTGTKGRIPARN